MSDSDGATLQRAATADRTDLDQRDVRALTEPMSVLPDTGRASGADGLFLVVSVSGSEYLVDARDERCMCPDARHRDVRCKHQRRVAYATGRRPIPLWCDPDAIDPQLGAHVAATPVVAATDGGQVRTGSDGEENAATADDGRPDDCSCLDSFENLPCWPCWRGGSHTPADVDSPDD